MSSISRVTGTVTGWDTDTMVKDLIKLEQAKVDKVQQNRDYADWQKDAYKEFSTLLRGLQSEYFDVLKPSQNLRSTSMYNLFTTSVTSGGTASTKVTATTSSSSAAGEITISAITALARKDKITSASEVKDLTHNQFASTSTLNTLISQGKDELKVTLDGVSKTITLAGGYTDVSDLSSELQTKLDTAFGAGKVTVGLDGAALSFVSSGHSLKFNTVDSAVLTGMGLYDGSSNVLEKDQTLGTVFGVNSSELDFTINGVTSASLGITSTTTVGELMDKINNSDAGVSLRYSSITNKFTFEATQEGSVNIINLTDTSSFFSGKLKLDGTVRLPGQDATVTVNGVTTTRSSNTFEVDGVSLTLKEEHAPGDPIKIGISSDATSVSTIIKGFVTKYNELVDKLGTSIGEKRYYSYKPLTDVEKEDMTEDQIKLWETKAKSGLLRSDTLLQSVQTKLRRALTDSVEGVNMSLAEMGIATSANYLENGKLMVDDTKLKKALTEKPAEVIKLFTGQSEYDYTDEDNRAQRYSDNGLGNRFNDIINDNIRLSRDSKGNRGLLIDKAGSELSTTDTISELAKKIKTYDTKITTLLELLSDKEDKYYNQFGRMETALQKMNSQTSSLLSSLGSS